MIDQATVAPVRKTVTVKTGIEHAFHVFTAGFDSWWPKSHHIGASPMTKGILEGKVGGRCYSEQQDGTECDWGSITAWEPPRRLVIAWQVTPEWKFEPDVAKSSEVELRFTALPNGETRVDLEHRYLERHGAGAADLRKGIDGEGGWGALLGLFASEAMKG